MDEGFTRLMRGEWVRVPVGEDVVGAGHALGAVALLAVMAVRALAARVHEAPCFSVQNLALNL